MVFTPNSKAELKAGVDGWCDGSIVAGTSVPSGQGSGTYGAIGTWDVTNAAITDMTTLFEAKYLFNDDIGNWDVSAVTTMARMFIGATAFNGDISSWNVSAVTHMGGMFNGAAAFNGDISSWDVSAVTNMYEMFYQATVFNQPIGNWNVSQVTDMMIMFQDATAFNQYIRTWKVQSTDSLGGMFNNATAFQTAYYPTTPGYDGGLPGTPTYEFFNLFQPTNANIQAAVDAWCANPQVPDDYNSADISLWDVSLVTDMSNLFDSKSTFNDDISQWNVSAVTDMRYMFNGATAFNSDILTWNVSAVTDMSYTFKDATTFNGDIRRWIVQSTDTLDNMLNGTSAFHNAWYNKGHPGYATNNATPTYEFFNFFQPITRLELITAANSWCAGTTPASYSGIDINSWDTSLVTDMSEIFDGKSTFNDDISSWDVSAVTSMEAMFNGATAFNGDISSWNVYAVTNMGGMFQGAAAFNGDISSWTVSSVTSMLYMFVSTAAFNGDLSSWDVSAVTNMIGMFGIATAFNQDIRTWNVSAVTDMSQMFYQATAFNQDIRTWTVQDTDVLTDMFNGASAFHTAYYPTTPGYDTDNATPSYDFFNQVDANICFPAGTLLSLDQGGVEIQNVDTKKHTLNGKKILFVTQTIPTKPDVVRIEKGAFAPNVPSQTVETTRAHIIEYNGERKMAEDWVDADKIHFVPNTHKILYNLLLETHEMMTVYNLQAETLNPVRKLAHKYFAKLK